MAATEDTPEQVLFFEADDGRIVFTERGRREMGDLFGRAGIPLETIKTRADYLWARKQARPFFREHLEAMFLQETSAPASKEAECEQQMLWEAVFGTEEAADAAREKRDRLFRLRVIDPSSKDPE